MKRMLSSNKEPKKRRKAMKKNSRYRKSIAVMKRARINKTGFWAHVIIWPLKS